MRILMYLQNRNLIIDEANVARNVYGRSIPGLALPLKYEQFAPLLFLWAEKAFALLLGYSEYALRLFPLLCGIAALPITYLLLRALGIKSAWWYPLWIIAVMPMMLRYSSEVKQYMGDVLVTSTLLLFTLKMSIHNTQRRRFIINWAVLGTLSILLSMPSVFVLAGVGCYYAWDCIYYRNFKGLATLMVVAAVWLAVFGLYFELSLKAQSETPILVNFHRDDFLVPQRSFFWWHNWPVLNRILRQFGDTMPYTYKANLWLVVIGIASLLLQPKKWLLLMVPILAMVVAACLEKYSLAVRLTLFCMPILLAIIGYGFDLLYQFHFKPWQLAITIAAIACAYDVNDFSMLHTPMRQQEFTEGLRYLQQQHIKGSNTVLYPACEAAWVYYTTIHPQDRVKYADYKDAHLMTWTENSDSLWNDIAHNPACNIKMPMGLVFTSISAQDAVSRSREAGRYLYLWQKYERDDIHAYIYLNTVPPGALPPPPVRQ